MIMVVLSIQVADHVKGNSSTHLYTTKGEVILVFKCNAMEACRIGSCDTEQAGWKFKGYMQDLGTDSNKFRFSEHTIEEARHIYSGVQKCMAILKAV
jgi:hypothetical protein